MEQSLPPDVDRLIEQLKSPDPGEKIQTIRSLADLDCRDEKVRLALERLAWDDPDVFVRTEARYTLGKLGFRVRPPDGWIPPELAETILTGAQMTATTLEIPTSGSTENKRILPGQVENNTDQRNHIKSEYATLLGFTMFILAILCMFIETMSSSEPEITLSPGIDLDIPEWIVPSKYCVVQVDDNPKSLRFYVRNRGVDRAPQSIATVRYDFLNNIGDHEQKIQVPEIQGGGKVRVSTIWDSNCEGKICTIRLQVDATNLITETNEDNNLATCQDPPPVEKYTGEW
jgi:hypothetical protein